MLTDNINHDKKCRIPMMVNTFFLPNLSANNPPGKADSNLPASPIDAIIEQSVIVNDTSSWALVKK